MIKKLQLGPLLAAQSQKLLWLLALLMTSRFAEPILVENMAFAPTQQELPRALAKTTLKAHHPNHPANQLATPTPAPRDFRVCRQTPFAAEQTVAQQLFVAWILMNAQQPQTHAGLTLCARTPKARTRALVRQTTTCWRMLASPLALHLVSLALVFPQCLPDQTHENARVRHAHEMNAVR